jgi:aspartyl-tRNA synthetase
MEMSFIKEDGVMDVVETLMVDLFSTTLGYALSRPFPRLEYQRAMDLYGSDKPDIRYGMELTDISDSLRSCGFKVFTDVLKAGGVIKAINVKGGGASFSRKDLDGLNGIVVASGARGLFWAKIKSDGWQSSLAKFVAANTRRVVEEELGAAEGDLVIIVSDMPQVTNEALGLLRIEIGKRLHLVKPDTYSFVWITRFPLLEYSSEEERFVAVHHPFTAPLEEDLAFLDEEPQKVRARSYDVVLNGQEIGGGSVRIHTLDLQNQVFSALGLGKKEVREKFGFFLEALTYGTPPHAGIALGFDRLVAIMVGAESLRDVIAFPKTQRATCAVTDAPSEVNNKQLAELGLTLKES